jgi:hypothetical protein
MDYMTLEACLQLRSRWVVHGGARYAANSGVMPSERSFL